MTFPDVHLAGEAVVAFVDGELASVAQARALAHLDICAECRGAVGAQRDASRLLAGAPDPVLPAGLLGRLREIPMTTELGGGDVVLAVEGSELVWGTTSSLRARPAPAPYDDRGRSRPDPRPGRQDRRPASYPSVRGSGRSRRARRALAGAVAGLAFGVCVATASTSVYAHTNTPDRNLIRDINGGVIRPPVTGELTGVRNLRAPNRGDVDRSGIGRDGQSDQSDQSDPLGSRRQTGTEPGVPQPTSGQSGSRSDNSIVPVGTSAWEAGGGGRAGSVSGAGMR